MNASQQVQEQRLTELLRRQLGVQILAAVDDPRVTEIIINQDGWVWFEAYGKGITRQDCALRHLKSKA
jgi:Flp pilus assembly CpaF family ATPase